MRTCGTCEYFGISDLKQFGCDGLCHYSMPNKDSFDTPSHRPEVKAGDVACSLYEPTELPQSGGGSKPKIISLKKRGDDEGR